MDNRQRVDILERLKTQKSRLLNRYGVIRVGLFGSTARGSANEKSDIDIFYESGSKETTLADMLEMEAEIQATVGRKVDLVNLKYMNPLVKMTAQKDFIDA